MPYIQSVKIRNQLHGVVPADIKKPILRLWEEAARRDNLLRADSSRTWNKRYFLDDDVLIEGYKNQHGYTIFGDGIYVLTKGKHFDITIYYGNKIWHKTVKELDAVAILNEFESDSLKLNPIIRTFASKFLDALGASEYDLFVSVSMMNDKSLTLHIETDEDYEFRRSPMSISIGTIEDFAMLDATKIAEDFLYQETN